MKKIVLSIAIIATSLAAQTINIAVAANVSYAIEELKTEFKKNHPNTDIQVTLGSSGKLTAQIKNGAPYGLFMSANMKYPQSLYDDKIAVTKPVVYAEGALAYLSNKEQDFSKGIEIVKSDKISKIAVANPKTAPYGIAAIEAMKNGGVYESVKDKFVFAESISQTVAYTVTAADIGLIAKSSLYSDKMSMYKEGINWAEVDSKLYTPIEQGIVILKYGKNNSEYRDFYDFVLSDKAKKIFKSYGYITK
ncbi:MAG: molybdate ABC transporter substrate-binding protein [Sulfurimonas sp. RIFOXYD12_FULL_33_39]|uniref:molybdate ABC transporter substrate-binding protein n=1 Tax=unclassified Sulfurimonas TaxID=2623549 RepID=UPI0008BE301A|nr:MULTISPECIES: molybdate ABC transporter substrate-binding protein [unclassified Sulfurimonas]OHE10197.1 MAG: molybdate ABC transporter substrate-binding protein [Sulfurimonas sp. RIFOXYD12_FULL_33_39]OHE14582.1 MAG: molybdate ABC transporter substrate-binding protein [Sulfurimonas sp. RIFOXYD2_FULL_34_21]DAB28283.1 MAG TPA: molybdate ABC transporter substrate-binding protein [Sulfurimonas sp. UBA10385]